jgi:hypothetical protein
MTPSKAPIPFLGTWKLAKCESSRPDLPHPTAGITTFSQEEDGIHYSNDGVWSDGRTSSVSAVFQLDGNWYPVTGSLVADSLSSRLLDDASFEGKMKKGGVEVGTNRSIVSADGLMTGHWEFVGPEGTTITWETTSERQ